MWEYDVVVFDGWHVPVDELDKLGANGWEVFQIEKYTYEEWRADEDTETICRHVVYMKRPKNHEHNETQKD